MFTVSDLTLEFGGTKLFGDVNLKFTSGNCYGIIGANGAGKSTFLKLISGELEPTKGVIILDPNERMSVLKQDHFAYDEFTVLDTIIMGNMRLYEIQQQKDALYAKEDFSEEDGNLAAELEGEFSELGGWEAETEVSQLLQGLGMDDSILYSQLSTLDASLKVKILLAQALFGRPDLLLLDEPTNHLDIESCAWLEEFLIDFEGTVVVVSHDRHFLNNVCTHTVDIDFGKVTMFVGNYDFWYESSQILQKLARDKNKKNEEKRKELENFIARFSANKSKSKQATSRKKMFDKLTVEELPTSSRRYPFVGFDMDREAGKDLLTVEGISKTIDGELLLNNVSFQLNKGDKIAILSDDENATTALMEILAQECEPDTGFIKWGVSTSQSYFPMDNTNYFGTGELSIINWLSQYSVDVTETYLRGFLGRMLFSGEEVFKQIKVLSGGEKVRCMLSRMMLKGSNVLLLDQPTNHLDLESIEAVNNGLLNFKGNVIFSSHDHQFMQTVANRIIEITPDGINDRVGDYDDFLEWKREQKKAAKGK